jgi:hypothetical protein
MTRLFLVCGLMTLATGAWAQTCIVADPSGTPLNVRAHPNGPIRGALHNGAAVEVLQRTFDADGDPWVFVAPVGPGKAGWVFRNYLTCGQ